MTQDNQKTPEETLSDHIASSGTYHGKKDMVKIQYVKQFIQDLKMQFDDGLEEHTFEGGYIIGWIDRLAGRKLT